jgi:plastocyanin
VRTRRRALAWGLLVVAATSLGVAGCSQAPSPGTSTTGAPASAAFTIKDYTFPELAVAPGQKITVVDADSEPHTVTADDGSFDTGSFDTEAPGMLTAPTTPGVYPVHCTVHPTMHGKLTVH